MLVTTAIVTAHLLYAHDSKNPLLDFVAGHADNLAQHIKRNNVIKKEKNQSNNQKKSSIPAKSHEENAFDVIKEAAEDGYVPAQDLVAYCYATGSGTKINNQLAFKWYMVAALAGSQSAKESLITCLEEGIGIAKDQQIATILRKEFTESKKN